MVHHQQHQLTYYMSIILSFYYLLSKSPTVLAYCDLCEDLPRDCQPGEVLPFSRAILCTCTPTQQPEGCFLKPCERVYDDSPCDCSRSTGSVKNRQFCRKYRCTGGSGQCETCRNIPPDCNINSYNNPPANGGPECSCVNQMAPGGCTMKLCNTGSNEPDPCVSMVNGVRSIFRYEATCSIFVAKNFRVCKFIRLQFPTLYPDSSISISISYFTAVLPFE